MPLRFVLAFVLALLPACPALAFENGLKALETGTDGKGWEAVGRLDLGRGSFCTGTLIADNLVLTAAHCLFDRTTGVMIAPEQIEFRAGWRNGRAVAYRGARRIMVDPAYRYETAEGADRVARIGSDLGLVELDMPIRLPQVQPFALDTPPGPGDAVGVVSYAHDRAEAPSLQSMCEVLMRDQGALLMNCAADFGASGAPVFAMRNGTPRIVSVVSAKALQNGNPVSLGALVSDVSDLRAAMQARRLAPAPLENRASGAKFVRPETAPTDP